MRRRPQLERMNPPGGMKKRWTREGEMTIDELRAAYTNMNEDKDEDEDEDEKASSEGDESTGGE